MKAVIATAYGSPDVLQIAEVPKPTPKPKEVLIRIRATSVTAGDCELRRFQMPTMIWLLMRLVTGITKPRQPILGQDISGEVEAIGSEVTRFKVGDQVFGTTGVSMGAYAEYKCVPETSSDHVLALKPHTMTYEQAAVVPTSALTAFDFLRKANVKAGHKVAILGAGGSIGTFALQFAKTMGAVVTGIDSGEKLDLITALGADHAIDFTQHDFTADGTLYDIIIDVAAKRSYWQCRRALTPNGVYLIANLRVRDVAQWIASAVTTQHKMIFWAGMLRNDDLVHVKGLIEAGTLTAVIDKTFTLDQMQDAHRYAESGHKRGNIAVSV
ncbi:MAG: NAD(P)-dependent alcohol dehydrogenase [Anaerolineae bacterium]